MGLDLAAELREFYGTRVADPAKELQEYYGRDWGDVVRDPGEAWDLLKGEEEIGWDLETGGLYPRRDPIAVVSLYGEKTTTPCIIHVRGSMPDAIREMFRWDYVRWTGHNIVSFDLHFLAKYFGSWVWDLRTYDTLVGETVIIPTGRRDVSVSLQAAAQRRLKVKIGKDADHRTWMNPTLTRTQVNYCVEDVVSLHKLRREQEQKAAERRLTKALDFEMALLPVVARMQWNGLPIDTVGLSNYLSDELVKADHAKSQLFATFGREINLNSVPQLRKALTDVGIPVPDTKAETLQSIVNFGGRKAEVLSNILDYRHAIKRNQVYKPSWVAENVQPHDGWYWIHAKWWQVGADTGRFTSSNPNLQQVPKHGSSMRQLFWAPGRTTVAGDYCLDPSTPVWTPIGKRPIKELQPGDWVYTYRDGLLAVGQVTASASTGYLECAEVTLDDGSTVVASLDHKWPTQGSGILTTAELRPGIRLVPVRKGWKGRYPALYTTSSFRSVHEHVLVAEATLGQRPPGHDVHHKDTNPSNNDPSNLEYRPEHDHLSEHSKESYAKQNHALRLEMLRVGIRNRASYEGTGNPRWKGGNSKNYQRKLEQQHEDAVIKAILNHKVANIRPMGLKPTWAITVEPDHNYVLGCGVVTQNSQIEVRIAAHLANDRELLRVLMDEDVHRAVAASVFGIRPDQVTDEQRQLAKAMSFLFLFGGTAKKLYAYVQLAGQVDFTMARAQEIFDAFFRRFQGLWLMRLRAEDMASRGGSVSLEWPSGLRRRLFGHDLKSTVILNNSVQGTAASGIKKAMLECMKRGLWVWLGAQVHDELVCHPPEREAPEFAHELEEAMLEGMRWAVPDTPLKVEVSVARTWAGPKVP